MSMSLRPIRRAIKPAVDSIRASFLKRRILNGLGRDASGYIFTQEDVGLYVQERFCRLPEMEVENTDEADILKVTIGERSIFWPANLAYEDLPWLYHEVFDAFGGNPSSYDNPSLDYGRRKWILDAGTAEGYFSVFALEKSNGKVLSVEPLSAMRRALARTLASHGDGRDTLVVSAALAEKPGLAQLQIDGKHVCDTRLIGPSDASRETAAGGATESVALTTIDLLAAQHSLAGDGLIKMDVEGYEMAALSGAANTLRDSKPALAIAVYHEFENARKCAAIIKAANSTYEIRFRGYYGYFSPPRPYMLFAK